MVGDVRLRRAGGGWRVEVDGVSVGMVTAHRDCEVPWGGWTEWRHSQMRDGVDGWGYRTRREAVDDLVGHHYWLARQAAGEG